MVANRIQFGNLKGDFSFPKEENRSFEPQRNSSADIYLGPQYQKGLLLAQAPTKSPSVDVQKLINRLLEGDQEKSDKAAQTLQTWGKNDPDVIDALAITLENLPPGAFLKMLHIAKVLGKIGGDKAETLLIKIVEEQKFMPLALNGVVRNLSNLKSKKAVPVFEKIISQSTGNAFLKITAAEAILIIEESGSIREKAIAALQEQQKSNCKVCQEKATEVLDALVKAPVATSAEAVAALASPATPAAPAKEAGLPTPPATGPAADASSPAAAEPKPALEPTPAPVLAMPAPSAPAAEAKAPAASPPTATAVPTSPPPPAPPAPVAEAWEPLDEDQFLRKSVPANIPPALPKVGQAFASASSIKNYLEESTLQMSLSFKGKSVFDGLFETRTFPAPLARGLNTFLDGKNNYSVIAKPANNPNAVLSGVQQFVEMNENAQKEVNWLQHFLFLNGIKTPGGPIQIEPSSKLVLQTRITKIQKNLYESYKNVSGALMALDSTGRSTDEDIIRARMVFLTGEKDPKKSEDEFLKLFTVGMKFAERSTKDSERINAEKLAGRVKMKMRDWFKPITPASPVSPETTVATAPTATMPTPAQPPVVPPAPTPPPTPAVAAPAPPAPPAIPTIVGYEKIPGKDFQEDIKSGIAKAIYSNGDIYVGYLDRGLPEAAGEKGEFQYKSGEKYVGEVSDGKPDGQGTLYAQNGSVLKEGQWDEGKFVMVAQVSKPAVSSPPATAPALVTTPSVSTTAPRLSPAAPDTAPQPQVPAPPVEPQPPQPAAAIPSVPPPAPAAAPSPARTPSVPAAAPSSQKPAAAATTPPPQQAASATPALTGAAASPPVTVDFSEVLQPDWPQAYILIPQNSNQEVVVKTCREDSGQTTNTDSQKKKTYTCRNGSGTTNITFETQFDKANKIWPKWSYTVNGTARQFTETETGVMIYPQGSRLETSSFEKYDPDVLKEVIQLLKTTHPKPTQTTLSFLAAGFNFGVSSVLRHPCQAKGAEQVFTNGTPGKGDLFVCDVETNDHDYLGKLMSPLVVNPSSPQDEKRYLLGAWVWRVPLRPLPQDVAAYDGKHVAFFGTQPPSTYIFETNEEMLRHLNENFFPSPPLLSLVNHTFRNEFEQIQCEYLRRVAQIGNQQTSRGVCHAQGGDDIPVQFTREVSMRPTGTIPLDADVIYEATPWRADILMPNQTPVVLNQVSPNQRLTLLERMGGRTEVHTFLLNEELGPQLQRYFQERIQDTYQPTVFTVVGGLTLMLRGNEIHEAPAPLGQAGFQQLSEEARQADENLARNTPTERNRRETQGVLGNITATLHPFSILGVGDPINGLSGMVSASLGSVNERLLGKLQAGLGLNAKDILGHQEPWDLSVNLYFLEGGFYNDDAIRWHGGLLKRPQVEGCGSWGNWQGCLVYSNTEESHEGNLGRNTYSLDFVGFRLGYRLKADNTHTRIKLNSE